MTVPMLLLGAGFMGQTHIEAVKDSPWVRYIGVVDSDFSKAEKLAGRYGLSAFANLESAAEAIGHHVRALDICTPTFIRSEPIQFAIAHRWAVLCEKPLAQNPQQAQQIITLCQSHQIPLMVAQTLRFWPEYQFAVQVAKQKKFGLLKRLECKRLSAKPNWNNWMVDSKLGKGAVLDLQIHDIDFVYQMLGRPVFLDAWGIESQGAFNHIYSVLHYPEVLPVAIEASYLMPCSYPFRMLFRLDFEDAVIEMDFWREKRRRLIIYPHKAEPYAPELTFEDAYRAEIEYFARCLLNHQPFERIPNNEVLDVLEICAALEQKCFSKK